MTRISSSLAALASLGLVACGDAPAGLQASTPRVLLQGLAPVNALPSPQTTNEDTRLDFSTTAGNGLSVSDADNANTQVQIIVTSGTFTVVAPPATVNVTGNGTSIVVLTGPVTGPDPDVDGVNGALNGTFYQPAANFTGAATLQMNSSDTNGEVDFDVLNITVTAFNDPPANNVPTGVQAATEDAPRAFSLSVNDVDIGSANLLVSLTSNNGTLMTLPLLTGLSFTVGDGAADGSMTFTGSLPTVNSALNGLTVTAPANFVGTSNLLITSNDQGQSGAGIAGADSDEITINWAAVNDSPINTVPAAQSIVEEGTLTFAGPRALLVDDIDGPTTLVQVTLSATGGTLSLGAAQRVEFSAGDGVADATMTFRGTLSDLNGAMDATVLVPTADFTGTAVVTMVSNDLGNSGVGGARQDSDSINVVVTGVNDAPINTVPGSQFASEDVVFAFANASRITVADVDAEALQVTLTATNGTLTVPTRTGLVFQAGDGVSDATMTFTGTKVAVNTGINALQFLATPNFNGSASLTVLTSDLGASGTGGTLTDSDSIAIAVAPVNDAPDAVNDAITIVEDAAATQIAVLANDTAAPDVGETLSILSVQAPQNGSAVIAGTVITYTAPANFSGIDTFSYTTSDGTLTDTANVTVNVTNVNDPPTAAPDTFTIAQATTTTLGVLSNDSGAPDLGETLTISALTQPTDGVVSINVGGTSIRYTPNAAFVGNDAFTYTLSDGVLTATTTVSLIVTAVNTTPVNTLPGPQTTSEDTSLFFANVAGNPIVVSDSNNAALTVQVVVTNGTFSLGGVVGLTVTGNGSASVTAQGTIAALNTGLNNARYVPAANFNGSALLTITSSDTNGEEDTDALTLTVTSVNDLPVNVVPAGVQAAVEDTPRTFINVSASDRDIGGGQAIVTLAADNGTLITLSTVTGLSFTTGDGTSDTTVVLAGTLADINTALNGLTVTAPTDFIGASRLVFTTDDRAGGESSNAIELNWTAVNDPPVNIVPGALTVTEETSLTLASGNGTAIRVSDVDVSAGFAQMTLSASAGTVTLGSTAGLSFTVGDGNVDASVTFSGTLSNINTALDGLVYAPPANFAGAATLTVVANDLGNSGAGGARTDTDIIAITVAGVNDAPINGVPVAQSSNEDVNRVFSASNANQISVVDVDAASVQVSLSASNGAITLLSSVGLSFQAGDGTLDETMTFTATLAAINVALANVTFSPTRDFNGAASLTVLTSDLGGSGAGGALTDSDTIVITINPVNDAPDAVNDTVTIAEDPVLAVSIPVLANDRIAPDVGETLAINSVTTPANGTAVIVGTSINYQPAANFFGADSFSYEIRDGNGGIDTATVAINVTSVNDAPTARDDSFSVLQNGGAVRLNLLSNDSAAPDIGETLTITAVTTPGNGGAIITGNGATVDYTPNPAFTGSDVFTYTLSDGVLTTTAVVRITVVFVNDNPVNTLPPPQTTNEDTALFFSAVAGNPISVTDANSATLTIEVNVANGTFTLGGVVGLNQVTGNGSPTVVAVGTIATLNTALNNSKYTPTPNFNGASSLTLSSSDSVGFTDIDTLTMSVTSSNDFPVNAVPSGAQAAVEDTPRTFSNISISDLDVGAGQLLVQLTADNGTKVTIGTAGLQFVVGDGTDDTTMTFTGSLAVMNAALNGLTITPPTNFIGGSTLVLRSNDQGNSGLGGAREDTDTVTLNWVAANDPPQNLVPAPQTINEDTLLVFSSGTQNPLRFSDVDAAGALMKVTITATNGTFSLGDVSNLTFTTGDGVNDTTMVINGSLANLNLAIENASYAPTSGFVGAAQLTVATNDNGNTGGAAQTDTDVIAITVNAVNDAPVNSVPSEQTVAEDGLLTFNTGNDNLITASDFDATSLQLTLSAANGTISLSRTNGLSFQAGDGTNDSAMVFRATIASINAALAGLTFRPNANFNGLATLTMNSNDQGAVGAGGALFDEDVIDISVSSVNDAPVAVADEATTEEDAGPITIAVLGNDTELPDIGETLVITLVGTVTNGVANTDGRTITYQPQANFNGIERFTYTISDGQTTAQAQVTVGVTSINDLPTAQNDVVTVNRNAGPTVLPLLVNDLSAPDFGEILRVVSTTTPAHGSIAINGTGTVVTYTVEAGYVGPDAFDYTISDGNGGTAQASVAVNVVAGVNNVPVVVNDTRTVAEDSGVLTIAILANDTGIEDAPLVVAIVAPFGNGSAVLQLDNTLTYTPAPNFSGSDSLRYSVTDADGETATGTLTVNVTSVDDVPVTAPDSATVAEDDSVNVEVLGNDAGLGDPPFVLSISVAASNGAVVIETDNSVTYTPAANFFGTDTFSYTAVDATQQRSAAVVTITVTPVADAPDAVADVAAGRADVALDIDALANDTDADGDVLVLEIGTTPGNGTASIVDGVIRYVPQAGFSGTDQFDYIVRDAGGLSDNSSVVVSIGIDTDSDGLIDLDESAAGTNPDVADTDGDRIVDGLEVNVTNTNPLDDDSDDDGLLDGNEDLDFDGVVGPGETGANFFDTDLDGLSDGLERGLSAPEGDDTAAGRFVADLDPGTTTDGTNRDTDGDGFVDGAEDANANGRLDPGEFNPSVADAPAPGEGEGEGEGEGGCACSADAVSGTEGALALVVLLGALRRRRRPLAA